MVIVTDIDGRDPSWFTNLVSVDEVEMDLLTPATVLPGPSCLPFEQLTPRQFEILLANVARKAHGYQEVRLYGSNGHRQYGIDVAATNDGKTYVGYQAKRVVRYSGRELTEAVETFLSEPPLGITELVIVHACEAGAPSVEEELRRLRRLHRGRLVLRVISGHELSVLLADHPDLVERAFGPLVRERFCGSDGHRIDSASPAQARSRVSQVAVAAAGGTVNQIAGDQNIYLAR